MRNTHNVTPKYYSQVHFWLRKHFIKNECEGGNCTGKSKRIEWALIKGKEYEMNRENFICLCKSCHSKYDITEETRRKIGKAFKGKKFTKKQSAAHFIPVVQLNEKGELLSIYDSVRQASKHSGVSESSICHQLSGRYKFTKNAKNGRIYLWKYKKDYGQK